MDRDYLLYACPKCGRIETESYYDMSDSIVDRYVSDAVEQNAAKERKKIDSPCQSCGGPGLQRVRRGYYHGPFPHYCDGECRRIDGGPFIPDNLDKIDCFDEEFAFLSNFFPAEVSFEDEVYPTVEHAYQAAKTLDQKQRTTIREQGTPGKAKKRGGKIELRPDWDVVKVSVMEQLLRQKFGKTELKKFLAMTNGAVLIEGNSWGDVFWGVCDGVGENHLGRILMKIRADILLKVKR